MSASGKIHPTAIIEDGAKLGQDVSIGPYSVVGPDVQLGNGVTLHSHVVVTGDTRIGDGSAIFPFASVGHIPQDKKFHGEKSRLEIGRNTTIREHVTINPGTDGGGGLTRIGDNCLLLAGSHVAHDAIVGNNVIFVNNATLGGHCIVGDNAILGGLSAVHQFVRIGNFAFVGGMSGVEADIIPFGMVTGNRASLQGLNIVGLKRAGFEREKIQSLRKAYRMLFSSEGTLSERMDDVEKMFADDENVAQIIAFARASNDRGLCVPRG